MLWLSVTLGFLSVLSLQLWRQIQPSGAETLSIESGCSFPFQCVLSHLLAPLLLREAVLKQEGQLFGSWQDSGSRSSWLQWVGHRQRSKLPLMCPCTNVSYCCPCPAQTSPLSSTWMIAHSPSPPPSLVAEPQCRAQAGPHELFWCDSGCWLWWTGCGQTLGLLPMHYLSISANGCFCCTQVQATLHPMVGLSHGHENRREQLSCC